MFIWKIAEFLFYATSSVILSFGLIIGAIKTAAINTEEYFLLQDYYNSWFFTYNIVKRLMVLDSRNTSSFLRQQYNASIDKKDFIKRCSRYSKRYLRF